ncbi:MAG: efflux RND transporter permease subunit [Gammaproteobacteria bacterium]
MNMTQFAISNNRVTIILVVMLILFGISSYFALPKAQDPGFIIRAAQVTTYFPGASPERVENLITDKLEKAIQEMPEVDFITSQSRNGISVITPNYKESYKNMRPIFDDLRRKVEDVKSTLPQGVDGPHVNDEFGDVYGIIYGLMGDGFSYAELKDIADDIKDELLTVDDVAKVQLQGTQEQAVFVEYNNARLTELGVSPQQLNSDLASLNIISSGGSIRVGPERITLEPSGNYESLDDLKKTVIQLPSGGGIVYLEDIATVYRDYEDPATQLARVNGKPAIILSISMTEGGNIVDLGARLDQEIPIIEAQYPHGISLQKLFYQPDYVNRDVANFMSNLGQAVAIIIAVLLVFLGLRTGLLVATMVPIVVVLTFVAMTIFDITINQVSLAALIIALGLLVDNAIVVSEGVLVKLEQGEKVTAAAIGVCRELSLPLLISSLTTAAAFLPIFLAESTVGEYTADIFKVVTIALMISWVLAMTFLPLMATYFLKLKKQKASNDKHKENVLDRRYDSLLRLSLNNRMVFLGLVVVLFFVSIQGLGLVPKVFMPPKTDSIINAKFNMPRGTDIEETAAVVSEIEKYFIDNHLVDAATDEAGIKSWITFIGLGSPRYVLSVNPDPRDARLAQLVINTNSYLDIPAIIEQTQTHLRQKYPDLEVKMKKLENGSSINYPIEVRVHGKDTDKLYEITNQVKNQLLETSGVADVVDDWGLQTKKLLVTVDQSRARRAGVTSEDVAVSLQAGLSGIELTEFREEDELIPITLRSVSADREDLAKLDGMTIYSKTTGNSVPLKQVADVTIEWQPPIIYRRDGKRTITIGVQLVAGITANQVNRAFSPWLEQQALTWPRGYGYEEGGESETSGDANDAIAAKLPLAGMLILLLLVGQFNSVRKTTIILTTIPLGMIGVTVGLIVANSIFGFMTILGVISLAGIIINNAIVLIDRIQIELEEGKELAIAIVDAAKQRMRPILLTTATTIGGMLPLWISHDPMFETLAIAVIFGLAFATVITLLFVPVLYSILYRVKHRY